MARLYLAADLDAFQLDIRPELGPLTTMVEVGEGIYAQQEPDVALGAIHVEQIASRGGLTVRVYPDGDVDCLYLDVSDEAREPLRGLEAAADLWVYVDDHGQLVGIELTNLAAHGGLEVDQLQEDDELGERPDYGDRIEASARWRDAARAEAALAERPLRQGRP